MNSNYHMAVETQHTTHFGQETPFPDQILIKIYSDGKYVAHVTAIRIPSSYRKGAADIYGVRYDMAKLMKAENKELSIIADEMELDKRNAYQLDNSDLYQIVELFVRPDYRRKGIGTWILSNLQMMIKRITHDPEPVCVLYPPRIIEDGKVIFEVDQWVKNLYTKNNWVPVNDGAHTLYYY